MEERFIHRSNRLEDNIKNARLGDAGAKVQSACQQLQGPAIMFPFTVKQESFCSYLDRGTAETALGISSDRAAGTPARRCSCFAAWFMSPLSGRSPFSQL